MYCVHVDSGWSHPGDNGCKDAICTYIQYLYCFCIGVDFQTHSDFKAFENLDDDVRQEKYQVPLDLLRFIVQSGYAVIRCVQTCGQGVEGAVLV